MANDEASFKREFRKDLEKHYGDSAEIWTHTDMMRSGLPDMAASFRGSYFPIEAKFVAKTPKRLESLVLCHELTAGQGAHLRRILITGNHPVVLVGFPDIAVFAPYMHWPQDHLGDGPIKPLRPNITLQQIKSLRDRGLAVEKIKGTWQVGGFFERVIEHRKGQILYE